jgi:hypothetical protein
VGDVGLEEVVEPSAVPTERALIEQAVQAGWRDFGFELGIEGLEGEVGLEFVLVAKPVGFSLGHSRRDQAHCEDELATERLQLVHASFHG